MSSETKAERIRSALHVDRGPGFHHFSRFHRGGSLSVLKRGLLTRCLALQSRRDLLEVRRLAHEPHDVLCKFPVLRDIGCLQRLLDARPGLECPGVVDDNYRGRRVAGVVGSHDRNESWDLNYPCKRRSTHCRSTTRWHPPRWLLAPCWNRWPCGLLVGSMYPGGKTLRAIGCRVQRHSNSFRPSPDHSTPLAGESKLRVRNREKPGHELQR